MKTTTSSHSNERRYLRHLVYLVPVLVIILSYGGIVAATGEPQPFTVVGGPSMQPTILPGSITIIANIPFNQLAKGDIIVFTPQVAEISPCNGGLSSSVMSEPAVPCYVIHRIASIQHLSDGQVVVTTKGDDNPISYPNIDTGVNQSMYLGKVVAQIPLAGYLTVQPYNIYAAILILVALIADLLLERRVGRQDSSNRVVQSISGNTAV